jgi:hypothetical protein
MKLTCTNCGRTAQTKTIGADPFCEPDGEGDYNAWDGTDGHELCPQCKARIYDMRGKHAPGPWVIGGFTGRTGADTQGDIIIKAPDRCAVALVCYHGDTGEKEANARLIAAAPEMERNLALILEVSERNNYADYRAAVRELARAALEKAGVTA